MKAFLEYGVIDTASSKLNIVIVHAGIFTRDLEEANGQMIQPCDRWRVGQYR